MSYKIHQCCANALFILNIFLIKKAQFYDLLQGVIVKVGDQSTVRKSVNFKMNYILGSLLMFLRLLASVGVDKM